MEENCPKCNGHGRYWSNDGEFGENEWKCERCKGSGVVTDKRPNEFYGPIYAQVNRPPHNWGPIKLPPKYF